MTDQKDLNIEYSHSEIEEFVPITEEIWLISFDEQLGTKHYCAEKIVGVVKNIVSSYNPKDFYKGEIFNEDLVKRSINWAYCVISDTGFEVVNFEAHQIGLIFGELTKEKILKCITEDKSMSKFVGAFEDLGTLENINK